MGEGGWRRNRFTTTEGRRAGPTAVGAAGAGGGVPVGC